MSAFPERLKAARLYRGMKQEELSVAAGFSHSVVNGWENGRYAPRGKCLLEVARILDVAPAALMGEAPFPWEKPASKPKPKGDPDAPPPGKLFRQHVVRRHTAFGVREKIFNGAAYQEAQEYCKRELKLNYEVVELITRWTRVI